MCPFRHTKALKKPNYTQANCSKTPRVKCLTSGITPFCRRDAFHCGCSGSNQTNTTIPVICRSRLTSVRQLIEKSEQSV